jgi:hypothetical protein
VIPPLLEDCGESAAHLSAATGRPAVDHSDQIRNRLIGRGDRLLLLRPRCDRETYHLADRLPVFIDLPQLSTYHSHSVSKAPRP